MTERQAYWLGIAWFLATYFTLLAILDKESFDSFLIMLGAWQFGTACYWLWNTFVTPKIVKSTVE
jgi:hypothetical protein